MVFNSVDIVNQPSIVGYLDSLQIWTIVNTTAMNILYYNNI